MTSLPTTTENPSEAPPNSSSPLIEIYLFRCGHGDTILVHLPDERWGLIDCYLPENGVRQDFFRFINTKGIKTFDFIFQTHPDFDHYHGMEMVIEFFLAKGEKIGYYIDTGVTSKYARSLLNNRPGASEYETLQDKLEKWDRDGHLKLCELDAERFPFSPIGYKGIIDFIPIGPDARERRRIFTSDLRRSALNSSARLEANRLSIIVVLSAKINNSLLNILLCADADADCVKKAMDVWRRHAQERRLDAEFDAIKIPHHGSIKSHATGLCQLKRPGSGLETAAVSSGTRSALPDRAVLSDYLQHGWNVMATTTRGGTSATSLPMMLANRGGPDDGDLTRHTICLSWAPSSGLSVSPDAAKIKTNELDRYKTASA